MESEVFEHRKEKRLRKEEMAAANAIYHKKSKSRQYTKICKSIMDIYKQDLKFLDPVFLALMMA